MLKARAPPHLRLLVAASPAAAAVQPLGAQGRISAQGNEATAGAPRAAFDAGNPGVAYNPERDEYLVVWTADDDTAPRVDDEFEAFARRMSGDGVPLGPAVRISDMGPDGNASFDASNATVAYNPDANQYLVVWEADDTTDDELEVYGQRLSATGIEIGTNDLRISAMGADGNPGQDAFQPVVAYSTVSDRYLVAWHADDTSTDDNEFEIWGQLLTGSGAEVGTDDARLSTMGTAIPAANFTGQSAAVAYDALRDEFLVVWTGATSPRTSSRSTASGSRRSRALRSARTTSASPTWGPTAWRRATPSARPSPTTRAPTSTS